MQFIRLTASKIIAVFGPLRIPLIAMNLIGVASGIVWLLIEGEWITGLVAIGAFLLSPVVLMVIIAVPLFALRFIGGWMAANMGNPGIWLALQMREVMAVVYWLAMGSWGIFVFKKSFDFYEPEIAKLPYLMVAYSVSTCPWIFNIENDDGANSLFSAIFIQLSCLWLLLSALLGIADLSGSVKIYGYILFAGFGLAVFADLNKRKF